MLYHVEISPKAPDAKQSVRHGLGGAYLWEKEEEREGEEEGEDESSLYRELAVGGA